MCGKGEVNVIAHIEGVELSVCQNCAKYGKILRIIRADIPQSKQGRAHYQGQREGEQIEMVVEDFGSRIRQKREQLKLTQQEFAKMLNEKESAIHHLENGSQRPSLDMAKRLERVLKIKLVEIEKEVVQEKVKSKSDSFTLGDFIKVKK